MKRIAILAACAALMFSAQSCRFIRFNESEVKEILKESADEMVITVDGKSSGESMDMEVSDYDSLVLNVSADIVYENSDAPVLKITAKEGVLSHVVVNQEGRKVTVSYDSKGMKVGKGLIVRASSSALRSLEVNGAVDFTSASIKGDTLSLSVNGAADITMDGVDYGNISLEVNGAGDVSISGKAESASISINGAGDVDVSCLECEDVATAIHGLGKVKRN